MKPELQVKFLRHWLDTKHKPAPEQGFTLIELLVVIIIIGILSAIALPSFLNQANRARESEAKQYIGAMNRAQQAYYLEATAFVDDPNFSLLGLGIATETTNYKYVIAGGGAGNINATNQAQPKAASAPIKAYIGGVAIGTQVGTGEATTLAILCEARLAPVQGGDVGTAIIGAPAPGTAQTCPAAYKAIN